MRPRKPRLWWWLHNHRTAKLVKASEKWESCWTRRNPDEKIKNFKHVTMQWVLSRLPRLRRQAHVVALLKPGKGPSSPKSFRSISLSKCHLYKLYECLILNRLSAVIEYVLIPEQAGFRPGKSCTAQVLNLTQHIEYGFERGKITGIIYYYRISLGCLWHCQPSETAWEGLQHDKGLLPDVHHLHSTGEPSFLRGTRREKK